jgi:hypothetical protein
MLWLQRKADFSLHARALPATGAYWRILFLCDLFLFSARDVRTTIFDQVATGQ